MIAVRRELRSPLWSLTASEYEARKCKTAARAPIIVTAAWVLLLDVPADALGLIAQPGFAARLLARGCITAGVSQACAAFATAAVHCGATNEGDLQDTF